MGLSHGKENIYEKYGQPTLDLVFTGAKKSLTDRVSNVAVEFSRTTTATYVGSDGLIKTAAVDEARFDHDPTTGEILGLLVEEARTNTIPTSAPTTSQLTNIYSWITMADGFTAPDGTSSAVKLTSTETTDQNSTNRGVNSSTSYPMPTTGYITVSVYVKPLNSSAKVTIAGPAGNAGYYSAGGTAVDFTVSPPTVTVNTTNGFVSGACTDVGNGWYRLHYVFDLDNSGTTPGGTTTGPRVNPYGAGTEALFWGLQMEAGTFPTSYIPTTSSTVIRATDVAIMTGTNFSSWFNPNEGTLQAQASALSPTYQQYIFRFWQGAGPAAIGLLFSGSTARPQFYIDTNNNPPGDRYNPLTVGTYGAIMAGAYKLQDSAAAAGGALTTNTANGLPANLSQAQIGRAGTAQQLSGHISRLTYWPKRLPDSDLQSLTE